ncbi:oligosaccharide flippase family protein [Reinekea sp. G2M2-21]|uniref:oligosaccharide flippase family protein n=1 Tax=Reinekea sp. G2M2-21 TaxID=2788942 RepID=UPI0018ABE066|nr:oligosaccharide flippase family protein [Reinekea sp. G2M2-21]
MPTAVKSSSIYAASELIRSAASLVMLPIYTRFLAPSDYGIIELLTMVLDLFAVIAGLRLGPAIIRLIHSELDKSEVVTASVTIAILVSITGVILITSTSNLLSMALFDSTENAYLLKVFSISLFAMLISEVFMAVVRGEERPRTYLVFSVFKLSLQIALNVYFIVFLELKATGFVYSSVITGLFLVAVQLIYFAKNYRIRTSKAAIKAILLFSTPLALGAGAEFITTYMDRFLLTKFHDLTDVGIYSLAYKFGFILVMISWYPVSMAWEPIAYRAVNNLPHKKYFHDNYYLIFTFVLLGTLGVGLFSSYVIHIMAAIEYHDAKSMAYLICIAYLAQSIGDYVKLGFMHAKKTIHMLYANIFTATLAVLLYLLLIPKFGAYGAAVGTIVSLSSRTIWLYFSGKKYHDLNINFTGFMWQCMLMLAVFFVAQNYLTQSNAFNFVTSIIIYIAASCGLIFIGYKQLSTNGQKDLIKYVDLAMAFPLLRRLRSSITRNAK